MSDEIHTAALRQILERSPLDFTRYFFKKREGERFIVNWHHEVISDCLKKVYDGEYNGKMLVINVPPGSSKTEMSFINFVPWCLAKNPRARFMHLSYSQELVELNSSTSKNLLESADYQRLWQRQIQRDTKSKTRWGIRYEQGGEWRNGGGVYATAIKGAVTGFRAGHMTDGFQGAIIIDDPLKVDDSFSTVYRRKVNELIRSTVKSRRATPDTPIILIMQRLHEDDPTGAALAGQFGIPVDLVKIPAINDDGTSYWEYKEPIDTLEAMVNADPQTLYMFYGQYMQEPAPIGNGEFSKDKVQFFDPESENFSAKEMNVYLLYDSSTGRNESTDYTAIVAVGLAPDMNYYILDIVRDRLNLTNRVEKLIKMHRKWSNKTSNYISVAVEEYAAMAEIDAIKAEQERQNYRFNVTRLSGTKLSKEDRIRRMIPDWDHYRYYLPAKKMYHNCNGEIVDLSQALVEDELMMFPVGKNDDMIDAMSRIYDVNSFFPEEQTTYYAGGETEAHRTSSKYNKSDFMSW